MGRRARATRSTSKLFQEQLMVIALLLCSLRSADGNGAAIGRIRRTISILRKFLDRFNNLLGSLRLMMQCPKCFKNFSDDNAYCLDDGTVLIHDLPEHPTVIVPPPYVHGPMQQQGVSPIFAYLAIGLIALAAGGGIVFWVKSDPNVASSDPTPLKTATPMTVASQAPEKAPELKKQQEVDLRQRPAVPQPDRTVPEPPSTISTQTYRVIGVAYNDVLFIRPAPNQLTRFVGKIPPNASDIQVFGSPKRVGKNVWVSVSYEGTTGWVNSKFLARQ